MYFTFKVNHLLVHPPSTIRNNRYTPWQNLISLPSKIDLYNFFIINAKNHIELSYRLY